MNQATSTTEKNRIQELELYDKTFVDFSRTKPDLAPEELKSFFQGTGRFIIFPPLFFPIETLSATKTVGRGRTNLTIISSTIVQTDSATPYAGFDRQATPLRNPAIQMHFEPSAYGITSNANYVMQFTIQAFGQGTFNLGGYAGAGTVLNAGARVLNGLVSVSLILQNVPPYQQTYGYLEQVAGAPWNWYTTQVRFPPLVITL